MKKIIETPKASSRLRPSSALDNQRFSFNSTKQETNAKLLTSVRHRNQNNSVEPQINSHVASKVVRDYILPLFNQDFRERSLEKRKKSLGLKHKKQTFSTFDGTLYTELKLSDQFSQDIKSLTIELQATKNSLSETEQRIYYIQSELNCYKNQSFIDQANLKSLIYQNEELQKQNQAHMIPNKNFFQQLIIYKTILAQLNEEKEKISKDLHDERALNDIRFEIIFIFLNYRK